MNIVTPYARLINFTSTDTITEAGTVCDFTLEEGEGLLRKIEFCGRISHRSEDKMTCDSWKRFIQAVVIDHGDWSIVEHASVTVDFLVDRGITHEIVRHRLMSFTQESTRFVNYVKKMPPSFIRPEGENMHTALDDVWDRAIELAEDYYKLLVNSNVPPQIARSLLPNALASRLLVTANLRSWRHFLIMRTTKESHPQMREVTISLLAEFKAKIPLLFDDIEPLQKQSEGMKRAR